MFPFFQFPSFSRLFVSHVSHIFADVDDFNATTVSVVAVILLLLLLPPLLKVVAIANVYMKRNNSIKLSHRIKYKIVEYKNKIKKLKTKTTNARRKNSHTTQMNTKNNKKKWNKNVKYKRNI